MNELIQRLSEGEHLVTIGDSRMQRGELKKRLEEMGYIFIKFIETRGGTDLGVRVDTTATDLSNADFGHGTGSIHVEGTLTLNYVDVRCIADIDLTSFKGTGKLVVLAGQK